VLVCGIFVEVTATVLKFAVCTINHDTFKTLASMSWISRVDDG
jgi:hypothetical protein